MEFINPKSDTEMLERLRAKFEGTSLWNDRSLLHKDLTDRVDAQDIELQFKIFQKNMPQHDKFIIGITDMGSDPDPDQAKA